MTSRSRQRISVTHDNMAIKLDGSEINKVELKLLNPLVYISINTAFMVSSYLENN